LPDAKGVAVRRLSIAAAVLAVAIAVPFAIGSSHREAPNIMLDPTADNTDTYAFTARDAPGALTIAAAWIPFEDPAGGPNFYRFDDRARYYTNIDNDGDGVFDIRYLFLFETHVRNRESFLYAAPQVTSFDDPELNVFQTYDLIREEYAGGRLVRTSTLGRDLPVAPSNVGPKTMPDYSALAEEAIVTLEDGTKVFAGQRDDPFFADLGAIFDAINLRVGTGNEGGGKDDLAGYAVHVTVLQIPEEGVTKNGARVDSPDGANAVVGVWSSTERRRLEVTNANFDEDRATGPGRDHDEDEQAGEDDAAEEGRAFVQVSRLGNPLVNEVIVPFGMKDEFNRTQPSEDAQRFGRFALNPEPARLLNVLFPGLNVAERDRTDIVAALLQGVEGLNRQSGKPVDTIKINLGTPPADTPNRFGVLANDLAGFPNGRRLEDDVVDIELRVIGGFLLGNTLPLGDGVDRNDKEFLATFPYLAEPDSGFDSTIKRFEDRHDPTPGDLNPPAP
jgi:hypothetical protein